MRGVASGSHVVCVRRIVWAMVGTEPWWNEVPRPGEQEDRRRDSEQEKEDRREHIVDEPGNDDTSSAKRQDCPVEDHDPASGEHHGPRANEPQPALVSVWPPVLSHRRGRETTPELRHERGG